MTSANLLPELKGTAALLVSLAKMDGHKFEKSITRYNDIADLAIFYGSLGSAFSPELARDSLRECVSYCIIGDPLHVTGKPLSSTQVEYAWMLP